MKQISLFAEENRFEKLSELGDSLERLKIIDQLFSQFNRLLEERGIITHKGTIVDATFVDAPRQRNSRDENEKIKNGEIPEEWKKNPHKMAQKDVDAR